MKIEGYSKHTYSLTDIHRQALAPPSPPPPPPHPHTQDLREMRGKWDSTGIHSIKLEITTLIENKKMEKKNKLSSLYVHLTSEFTHNKFQKVYSIYQ